MQYNRVWEYVRRIGWLVFAAVIWFFAYNMSKEVNMDFTNEGYLVSGFLCLIPIAASMIRFLIGATRAAGSAGSQVYDVSYTGYGFRITNNRIWYAVIAFIIIGLFMIALGVYILPIFWIRHLITTIIFIVRDIRNYR